MQSQIFSDPAKIKGIIDRCKVCYLGMVDLRNEPYVLPFNFAYEDNTLIFHSAREGKKIDILTKNPNVCATFSTDHRLFHRHEQVACSYTMSYRSVLAFGKVEFVEEYDEKIKCMNSIMRKYTGKEFSYNAPAIKNVMIFKLIIDKIEGKESGY